MNAVRMPRMKKPQAPATTLPTTMLFIRFVGRLVGAAEGGAKEWMLLASVGVAENERNDEEFGDDVEIELVMEEEEVKPDVDVGPDFSYMSKRG